MYEICWSLSKLARKCNRRNNCSKHNPNRIANVSCIFIPVSCPDFLVFTRIIYYNISSEMPGSTNQPHKTKLIHHHNMKYVNDFWKLKMIWYRISIRSHNWIESTRNRGAFISFKLFVFILQIPFQLCVCLCMKREFIEICNLHFTLT